MTDSNLDVEDYTYQSLDLTRRTLRLIKLVGDNAGQDTFKCELIEAFFDDDEEDLIPYYALSYTWGDNHKSNVVEIDGKPLKVTSNLHSALQHLYRKYPDSLFWIDAISIDQSDDRERTHQVGQMSEIYRRAATVIVWLGPSTPMSEIFMRSLKILQNELRSRPESRGYKDWSVTDRRLHDIWVQVQSQAKFQVWYRPEGFELGAKEVLRRSWFRRIWILQEVAYSSRIEVLCGDDSVLGHIFALSPTLLKSDIDRCCRTVFELFPGSSRNNSWWAGSRDLFTLLSKFSGSQASDPRDFVYAVIGMCTDDTRKFLEADYTIPLYEVIVRTFQCLFGLPLLDSYILSLDLWKNDVVLLLRRLMRLQPSPLIERDLCERSREVFSFGVSHSAIIMLRAANLQQYEAYVELIDEIDYFRDLKTEGVIHAAPGGCKGFLQQSKPAAISDEQPRFKQPQLMRWLNDILASEPARQVVRQSGASSVAMLLFQHPQLAHLTEDYDCRNYLEEIIQIHTAPRLVSLTLQRAARQSEVEENILLAAARHSRYGEILHILTCWRADIRVTPYGEGSTDKAVPLSDQLRVEALQEVLRAPSPGLSRVEAQQDPPQNSKTSYITIERTRFQRVIAWFDKFKRPRTTPERGPLKALT